MKNTWQNLRYVLALVVLASTSCNDEGNTSVPGADTTATGYVPESREADFVSDVLESSTKEIAWLKAGLNNGTDSELKTNAEKMLSDHETLTKELKEYAQNNNITVPDIDTSGVVDIDGKRGTDWDEEWADEVGDDHKQLVNRFERADRRISDSDTTLKDIIAKTLPKLQSHMDASKRLEDRLERNN